MLQSIDEIIEAGPNEPFRLTLDEADVNRLASEYVASLGGPIGNLKINLRPEHVVADGSATLAGMPLNLQVSLVPVKQEDQVRAEIESISLNGAPAPVLIRNQVAQAINRKLEPENLPVNVSDVSIGDRTVTIEGTTK